MLMRIKMREIEANFMLNDSDKISASYKSYGDDEGAGQRMNLSIRFISLQPHVHAVVQRRPFTNTHTHYEVCANHNPRPSSVQPPNNKHEYNNLHKPPTILANGANTSKRALQLLVGCSFSLNNKISIFSDFFLCFLSGRKRIVHCPTVTSD